MGVNDVRLPAPDDATKTIDTHPECLGIAMEEIDPGVRDTTSPQPGAVLGPVPLIARAAARDDGERMPVGLRLAQRRDDLTRAAPEERCDVQHATTTGGHTDGWAATRRPAKEICYEHLIGEFRPVCDDPASTADRRSDQRVGAPTRSRSTFMKSSCRWRPD